LAIAFVVPCYNEADRTDFKVFNDWQAKHPAVSFFFVNDGSTDKTLESIAQHFSQDRIIDLAKNCGKAEAVRQGMKQVCDLESFSHVGFLDADLATPLSEIPLFEHWVDQGKEVILGARILRLGGNIRRKWYRHYLGRFFATAASILLDLPIYDTQCGAKVFKADRLSEVISEPFTSKWIFDVELFLRLKQKGSIPRKSWHEIPLENWEDVGGSRLKTTDFLKAPFEMLSLYFKYGRG
jgi:dolichyl-phosphate beta-glucosyltransferase